jgi:predicted methyltransferase
MNERFFAMLKPGGRVLIEDHDADRDHAADAAGQPAPRQPWRRDRRFLRSGIPATELILIDSKYDDRRWNVFRPGVKGRTDHYIAVFQKPADGKALR